MAGRPQSAQHLCTSDIRVTHCVSLSRPGRNPPAAWVVAQHVLCLGLCPAVVGVRLAALALGPDVSGMQCGQEGHIGSAGQRAGVDVVSAAVSCVPAHSAMPEGCKIMLKRPCCCRRVIKPSTPQLVGVLFAGTAHTKSAGQKCVVES